MGEFKGTPGPWRTDGKIIECDSGIHTIGEISTWLPEFEDERKANARLIAAAPDLLEALQKMRGTLRSLQPALNVMAREVMDDIIKDLIDPAIACATGSEAK